MLVTQDGDVLPCSHGSRPVGNINDSSAEQIWNGERMQEVRASILRGEVDRACLSSECPFQRTDPVFPERDEPLQIDEDFARVFDEEWYLQEHPDVRTAVDRCRLTSGLEHFIRHGRSEGRNYRVAGTASKPLQNSVLGLVEYSRGATRLRARPVDLVFVVSTICNLRCVMCPQGMSLVEQPRHTPVGTIERMESFLATASRVCVSGLGEPMAAPAFWRLVEWSSGRDDLCFRVHSNGHLITAEGSERILNSGITELSFSLDAATPGTYSKIRGGDFDSAVSGISTLLRMRKGIPNSRLEVSINMTLMRENLREAAPFVALGKELGADAVVFSQLFGFGDRPDWRVDRGDWSFVYSEQVLTRAASEARHHISCAKKLAEEVAMPVQFFSNVLDYAD